MAGELRADPWIHLRPRVRSDGCSTSFLSGTDLVERGIDRLARGPHDGRPSAGAGSVFVGRESQKAALASFLDDVRDGPCALLLEGEPGIGKSVLWTHGIETAVGSGYRVLTCRPTGPDSDLSFVALGDLLSTAAEPFLDGAARTAARSAGARAPATDPCAPGAGSARSRRRHPRPPERDRRRSTDDRGDRRRAVDRSCDRTRTHVRRPAAVRRPGRLPARKTRDRGAAAPRAGRRPCGRATPPRTGGAARRARDRRHRAGADRPLPREARGLAAGRTLGRQPVLRARDRAGAGARGRGRHRPTHADPEEPS